MISIKVSVILILISWLESSMVLAKTAQECLQECPDLSNPFEDDPSSPSVEFPNCLQTCHNNSAAERMVKHFKILGKKPDELAKMVKCLNDFPEDFFRLCEKTYQLIKNPKEMTLPENIKNNSDEICRWFQGTLAECAWPILLSKCAYSSLQLFNVYVEALFNIFPYVNENIGECLSPTLPPEPATITYNDGLLGERNSTTDEPSDGSSVTKNGCEKRYMHDFVSVIMILICIIV
ncbi:hypothetical protein DdX_04533 [Ditylenchus destructor]|uniref:Uncharacterized protein n=1 Tax=Ditylenchus destructor TaxID=166010 RepID=A0AAD4R7U7_9BILA|nr:hypothetical protein DdX_04533 [Ditylenchus destructor]